MGSNMDASIVLMVGPALQAVGAALLCILFVMLRSHTARRSYFRYWMVAWGTLAVALSVLALSVALVPELVRTGTATVPWLGVAFFVYFALKFLYMAFLGLGVMSYARNNPTRMQRHVLFAVLFSYAAIAAWFSDAAHHSVTFQAPVLILGAAYAAWSLLSLAPERRTVGSRVTGAMFTVLCAVWALYVVVFWTGVPPADHQWPGVARVVVEYNWFLNLMVHMLMAHGMVLILMEDTNRDIDRAHSELAIAHRRLQHESMRDALTGALNRRAFASRRGLQQAWRSFGAVLVIDVDNLKVVNDEHGHAAGDELLAHLVAVIRRGMRATDTLYRWGGDEFLLVLPRADAMEMKQRYKQLLEVADPMTLASGQRIQVYASIGAASFQGGGSLEEAIRRADEMMYDTKRRHRS